MKGKEVKKKGLFLSDYSSLWGWNKQDVDKKKPYMEVLFSLSFNNIIDHHTKKTLTEKVTALSKYGISKLTNSMPGESCADNKHGPPTATFL
jgi:hypothetical protein